MQTGAKFDPDTHYALGQPDGLRLADVSHIRRKFLDVAYADGSSRQKLDIYLPDEGPGLFPVILSIHGGAFMGCDKSDTQVNPMLKGLERGYAVVVINYRLSWEAIFPALVHDAKAAVRWVRANADRYGFDAARIAAWGGSAGGYLCTMLGTSAGIPVLEDLRLGNPEQPSNVQAVIDWFGPMNFLTMDTLLTESGLPPKAGTEHSAGDSPESLLIGAAITEAPALVKAANPETYIRKNELPPFLIQHGNRDAVVPFQHSVGLAEKLRIAAGADKVALDILEGAGHADKKFETSENSIRCLDFLDRWLKV